MIYQSALGPLLIEESAGALTAIRIASPSDTPTPPTAITDEAFKQIAQFLMGDRRSFRLPISLVGTPFQKTVWEASCNIPYGETLSYSQIAKIIGKPGAQRAVGQALNRNPLMIVVPCHRVIGSSGNMTGYAYGTDIKTRLLEIERDNA